MIIVGYVVLSLTRPGFHLPAAGDPHRARHRWASPPVGSRARPASPARCCRPTCTASACGPGAYVFALATLFFGFALVQTIALFGVGLYTATRLAREPAGAGARSPSRCRSASWAARRISVQTFNRVILALLLASAVALVHEAFA